MRYKNRENHIEIPFNNRVGIKKVLAYQRVVVKERDLLLVIRCAACKNKLWKYDKIGQGEVLRCHKGRIKKLFGELILENDKVKCSCGKTIGIDKGTFIKMDPKAFVYSGTKRNK